MEMNFFEQYNSSMRVSVIGAWEATIYVFNFPLILWVENFAARLAKIINQGWVKRLNSVMNETVKKYNWDATTLVTLLKEDKDYCSVVADHNIICRATFVSVMSRINGMFFITILVDTRTCIEQTVFSFDEHNNPS